MPFGKTARLAKAVGKTAKAIEILALQFEAVNAKADLALALARLAISRTPESEACVQKAAARVDELTASVDGILQED